MGRFNEELHRRLDGEEERELSVSLLTSFWAELQRVIEVQGWREEEGVRRILAAGLRAIEGWTAADKSLDEMTPEEQLRFHQDRAASMDAAYSTMKFLAYQVMNQNDALDMNMKGLVPQLEAALARVEALEEEVRRLRALVPPEQRQGDVLIVDRAEPDSGPTSLGEKIRTLFRSG